MTFPHEEEPPLDPDRHHNQKLRQPSSTFPESPYPSKSSPL
jgi:hypothetical protein